MNDRLLNKKNENMKIAEKYITKYISDLQMHMSLSNSQLIKLLNNCIVTIKFNSRKFDNGYRKNTEKRWWQLFKKIIE